MSQDPLTYEDLLRIVELVKSSEQFSEFRLKIGDIEVELRRRSLGAVSTNREAAPQADVAPQPPGAPLVGAPATVAHPYASAVTPAPDARNWAADATVVRAPMVGTFYRAPEPGARPFVAVGDHVSADTVVCIIEVMKLLNSIPAGAEGVVTHILVNDGAPIEANAPLIVLAPDSAQ